MTYPLDPIGHGINSIYLNRNGLNPAASYKWKYTKPDNN